MKKIFGVFSLIVLSVSIMACSIASNKAVTEKADSRLSGIADANWLHGWLYRKAHNITGSGAGDQYNYPVVILVHYNDGYDNNGEVYLRGKCRTDFGDIRFTDSAGTSLDYWIQGKTDSVQAICWVKINYIPQGPDVARVYIYYGNSTASTLSNKNWVLPIATDFEDGTAQGWTISWSSFVDFDNVSTEAFEGNYCRSAGKIYGIGNGGTGDQYDSLMNNVYLAPGSYRAEGAVRFSCSDSYVTPVEVSFLCAETIACSVTSPGTQWHWLSGNFSIVESSHVVLEVKYHVYISGGYWVPEAFSLDSFLIRKYCDPEPSHGTWTAEETLADSMPPEIVSVEWAPTCPPPFIYSSTVRQQEPVVVEASVVEEVGGSGLHYVMLSYRADSEEWVNTTMTYNLTSDLWTGTVRGEDGGSTVEFFVTACDNAGNMNASQLHFYLVRSLPLGDANGDGSVDMADIQIAIDNFMKAA